nr:UDP-N-acetylmuramoylalanyl-D-glutamyl-2, 6-diaminopimelate--D-alanyl-D-alanine ligase [Saprospiraceae bacterium]
MEISTLYSEFLSSDGISIDTRSIIVNQIFFALPGERVDGNFFALKALEKGARLSVVSDRELAVKNAKCIYFKDTLLALQELAKWHRKTLNIPIIGITGSVAKTTTKELVNCVLESRYKTFATTGNLNNHIGVPLSILSINKSIEIAVIEMGANHIGEIEELCAISMPNHGLITRIGHAHLEG